MIGVEGGINLYAYVQGNPLSHVDPMGLDSDSITPICPECFVIPSVRLPWLINQWTKPQLPNFSPGLPPPDVVPPVKSPGRCEVGPSTRGNGQSLWDENGGEWRYKPEDSWHNPHWDYNPWGSWNSPWQNIQIGGKPPVKP